MDHKWFREAIQNFMVRLTVTYVKVGCRDFFKNKLTYFDLFDYFIEGKIGPTFPQLLMFSLTIKCPFLLRLPLVS